MFCVIAEVRTRYQSVFKIGHDKPQQMGKYFQVVLN